jgi:hypothetical protein
MTNFSKLTLSKAQIADYIVRLQYAGSSMFPNLPNFTNSDTLTELVEATIWGNKLPQIMQLLFKNSADNKYKASIKLDHTTLLRAYCMLSSYQLEAPSTVHNPCIKTLGKDWIARHYYYTCATDTGVYDGSRHSDGKFYFSPNILEKFEQICPDRIIKKHGFIFSQVVGISYAHAWNVVLAIRARDFLYKNEGVWVPITIYLDSDVSPNYHLFQSLAEQSILTIQPWHKFNEDIAIAGDHVSLLYSHLILKRNGIATSLWQAYLAQTNITKSPERMSISAAFSNFSTGPKQRNPCRNLGSRSRSVNIGLHVRDAYFKNQDHQEYRNSSLSLTIHAAVNAIERLPPNKFRFNFWIFGYTSEVIKPTIQDKIKFHNLSKLQTDLGYELEPLIIDHCDYFIGTSSGPGHIANALGLPTLFLESTNLHPIDLSDSKCLLSLKKILPSVEWFKYSPRERSLLIKADWNNGLLKLCKVESNSGSLIEEAVLEFIILQLFSYENKKYRTLGESLGPYSYQSAIDLSRVTKSTHEDILHLLKPNLEIKDNNV